MRFVIGKAWKQLAGASLTPLALGYLSAILLLLTAYGILERSFLEQMMDFQPQSPNSTVAGGYPHKPLTVFGPDSPDHPKQHPLFPLPGLGIRWHLALRILPRAAGEAKRQLVSKEGGTTFPGNKVCLPEQQDQP